jgi:hypothetical protein
VRCDFTRSFKYCPEAGGYVAQGTALDSTVLRPGKILLYCHQMHQSVQARVPGFAASTQADTSERDIAVALRHCGIVVAVINCIVTAH